MKIIINGTEKQLESENVSYEDIVTLSGYDTSSVCTITYSNREYTSHISKGQTVSVLDGMIVNVSVTNNA